MSWIVVDLETTAHSCAYDLIPAPNLDAIEANKNLKDPVKVAENIAQKKLEAQLAYEDSLKRAGLDWNVSRIVALAYQTEQSGVVCRVCKDEADEIQALREFWKVSRGLRIIGFAARNFDVPTMIQRSRLLEIGHPRISLNRWGRGDVIDLRDVLTFDDARYDALMPRSLKAFCRRFGIPVDDDTNGADIADFVSAENWDAVEAHCVSDVKLTVQLAKRIPYVLSTYQPDRELTSVEV